MANSSGPALAIDTVEQILITVRTYPCPSQLYRETVCTGGINRAGEWRRLYPVALRYLPPEQQYVTWDVVEVPVRIDSRDTRPETRRPNTRRLMKQGHLDKWTSRHQWVGPTIVPSLKALVTAGRSLGPVSVQKVLEMTAAPEASDWPAARKAKLDELLLFEKAHKLEKIPFRFRFRWRDGDGDEHLSAVISWEMAETWRQYHRRYTDPIEQMRSKLLNDYFLPNREVAFFMGNMWRSRKTFMVCGWYIPPRQEVSDERLF